MIENLETIQREHKKTLANLEEVKKLKRDQLKAAQVRKKTLRAHESTCYASLNDKFRKALLR